MNAKLHVLQKRISELFIAVFNCKNEKKMCAHLFLPKTILCFSPDIVL